MTDLLEEKAMVRYVIPEPFPFWLYSLLKRLRRIGTDDPRLHRTQASSKKQTCGVGGRGKSYMGELAASCLSLPLYVGRRDLI